LKRLYVRPEFRRRGVGQRLVKAALKAVKATRHHRVRRSAQPEMTAAQTLYMQASIRVAPINPQRCAPVRMELWL
jgi:ribosomal protein S18 acetylase RimI-like enzyme